MARSRCKTTFVYILSVVYLLHLAAGQTFQYSRGWTNGKKRSSPDFQKNELASLVSGESSYTNGIVPPDNNLVLVKKLSSIVNDEAIKTPNLSHHFVVSKKREPNDWNRNQFLEEAKETLKLKYLLRQLNAFVNVLATLQTERK